jgi:hypothetical protein
MSTTTIFGSRSGSLRQDHGLGGGDVVDGDQMVGDEFHPAAISISAKIGSLLNKFGE